MGNFSQLIPNSLYLLLHSSSSPQASLFATPHLNSLFCLEFLHFQFWEKKKKKEQKVHLTYLHIFAALSPLPLKVVILGGGGGGGREAENYN